MLFADQVSVNSSTFTDIVAPVLCSQIECYEENQAGTTDYYVTRVGGIGNPTLRPAGKPIVFVAHKDNPFQPLQKVGSIKVVTGSPVFDIVCQ